MPNKLLVWSCFLSYKIEKGRLLMYQWNFVLLLKIYQISESLNTHCSTFSTEKILTKDINLGRIYSFSQTRLKMRNSNVQSKNIVGTT